MKKKTNIKEYSNLYPCNLYVCTDKDGDQVEKLFYLYDVIDDAIDEVKDGTFPKMKGSTNAFTLVVKEQDSKVLGFLVALKPELIDENNVHDTITHESAHVADGFFEFIGATPQNLTLGNETYTYLIGWIAGCISNYLIEYRKNEFKKTN